MKSRSNPFLEPVLSIEGTVSCSMISRELLVGFDAFEGNEKSKFYVESQFYTWVVQDVKPRGRDTRRNYVTFLLPILLWNIIELWNTFNTTNVKLRFKKSCINYQTYTLAVIRHYNELTLSRFFNRMLLERRNVEYIFSIDCIVV